ncbi:MAG: hexitol phosphatase HxpB, partial [bacterium]|nr:hexitol phosphatase HxpB [bacterium]
GLLIESESLWRRTEIEIFSALGVPINETMCYQTMGLRTDEVVRHWYVRFPWNGAGEAEVAERIVNRVTELIVTIGQPMPGAVEAVRRCREMNFPLALATSSPMRLVQPVLKRLDLTDAFDVISSAENEESGKPHPAVYLTAARSLGLPPANCVAVEDSVRGVISALAAGMRCIAVPAPELRADRKFAAADAVLDSLELMTRPWLENFPAQTK